jgi:hypothetical protein
VAFVRRESDAGFGSAGVGITIDMLRRGDRAVVERMCAARAGTPSRFEQPDRPSGVNSTPPLRAEVLFADATIGRGEASAAAAAYLSADLTSDLPTVRPPAGMSSSAPPGLAVEQDSSPSSELADELEPYTEVQERGADVDETPAFVLLEPPRAARAEQPPRSAREVDGGVQTSDVARDPRSVRPDSAPRAVRAGAVAGPVLVLVLAGLSWVALSGRLGAWLGW